MKRKMSWLLIPAVILIIGVLAFVLWKQNPDQSSSVPGTLEVQGTPVDSAHVTVDGEYAVLPLLETAKQLGVQVQWADKDQAQLTYGSESRTLSLSQKELTDPETDRNCLDPLPGCTYYACSVEGSELLLDGDTLCAVLYELGLKTELSVDSKTKTVSLRLREDTEPEPTKASIEYVIYNDGTMGHLTGTGDANGKTGNVRFESVEPLGLYGLDKETFTDDALSGTREVTLGGSWWNVDYQSSYSAALHNCPAGQQRCIFDCYENDSGVNAVFHRCTGTLAMFSDPRDAQLSGPLTQDNVRNLSKAIVIELYSQDFLSEYPYVRVQSSHDGINELLCVTYSRALHGYPTEDMVTVTWYPSGELAAVYAREKGTFLNLEQTITREQLEAAEQTVRSAISDSWSCGEARLLFAGDGACYLGISASRESTDPVMDFEAAEFYIAVG